MCLIAEVDGLKQLPACLFLVDHGLSNWSGLLMIGPTSLLPSSSSGRPGSNNPIYFVDGMRET